jgi:hypothetical protein
MENFLSSNVSYLVESTMLSQKYQYVVQAIGSLLFATVCVAFIFGLQATTGNVVLHDQLAFRIVLGSAGSIFIVLVAAGMVLAYKGRK